MALPFQLIVLDSWVTETWFYHIPQAQSNALAWIRGFGYHGIMKRLPVVVLVAVNMVPLIGVLFLGWSLSAIMLLYWSENVVIGFYNVLRMIAARGRPDGTTTSGGKPVTMRQKPFMIMFFIIHYGIFTLVHGVFVISLFGSDLGSAVELLFMVALLFLSHGVSFARNFIGKGVYRRVAFDRLFWQPYTRVVVMHITIIIGGGVAVSIGAPTLAILVMVVLKIGADLLSHLSEHKKLAAAR